MQIMKTVTVRDNQTIYDLAVQYYGTAEAAGLVLKDNPTLANDAKAMAALGITDTDNFYADIAIKPGIIVNIDDDNRMRRDNTLKELGGRVITTFDTVDYGENY